jgi:hypothetical protein
MRFQPIEQVTLALSEQEDRRPHRVGAGILASRLMDKSSSTKVAKEVTRWLDAV